MYIYIFASISSNNKQINENSIKTSDDGRKPSRIAVYCHKQHPETTKLLLLPPARTAFAVHESLCHAGMHVPVASQYPHAGSATQAPQLFVVQWSLHAIAWTLTPDFRTSSAPKLTNKVFCLTGSQPNNETTSSQQYAVPVSP